MSKQKINYLSLASVISAFAVVILHTNGVFWQFSTESYWATANLIETTLYFAVPVFFMISGATLIDYRERYSTIDFFKKRISKTLIPFLAWSVVGVVYNRLTSGLFIIPLNALEWKDTIFQILNNQVVGVYWFFTSLFCVYLCIPLFSAVQKEIRLRVFQYLIAATLVFNIALPFITSVFPFGYWNPLSVDVTSGYLFFVLVGYVLNKQTLEKKWRMVSYALGVVGFLLQLVGTYVSSMEAGYVVTTFKEYTNLPSVMYSIAIFTFMKEVSGRIKSENVWRFINWAGKYTFAIYLIHWFVMVVLQRLLDLNVYSILYRLGFPVIVCGLCILIAWVMRKIPVIKKFVP